MLNRVWSSEGDRLCVWDGPSHNAVVLKLDLETGAIEIAGQFQFASRASRSYWFDNSSFNQELTMRIGRKRSIFHEIQVFRQALVLLCPGSYFEIYTISGELQLRVYLLADGYAALSPDGCYDGSGQYYQDCLAHCKFWSAPMRHQANLLQRVWSELV